MCTRCQTLHTECLYEAEEGESRWSALRRRSHQLEQERDDLREILSWLLVRPEQEAQEALQRIRGTGYDELLGAARQARGIRTGAMAPQAGPSSLEQRLPSIRTLVEVSGAGQVQVPMRPAIPPSMGSEGSGSVQSYSSGYSLTELPQQPQWPPEPHDQT